MAHNIAVIVGSLRKDAFSLKIAKAIAKLAPDTIKLNLVTLEGLSFFNQDIEANPPADWVSFREKLQASDGIIIVTPEYNRSIPGVLKNALDAASPPPREQPFVGKPVAIMSAGGRFGGVRAQLQLRQIGHGMGMLILSRPEVIVEKAVEKFDPNGNLTDTGVRDQVQGLVQALGAWAQRLA